MATNELFNVTTLGQGLISNLAFHLVIFLIGFASPGLKLYRFKLRDIDGLSSVLKRMIFLAILNALFLIVTFNFFSLPTFYFVVSIALFVFFLYLTFILYSCWTLLKRMKAAGIAMVDDQVETGVDYKKSLELCERSIKFLGIGAHKLTQIDEFQSAINRCDKNGKGDKIFLICDPNSEALVAMEKKNQKDSGNYKKKIIQSLRKIQDLKSQHLNISVFLYRPSKIEEIPVFRLFFIDDDSVLVSFYSIHQSNDEGKKLPQMKFVRKGATASFFFAFESYYENLLSSSTECKDIEALINSIK